MNRTKQPLVHVHVCEELYAVLTDGKPQTSKSCYHYVIIIITVLYIPYLHVTVAKCHSGTCMYHKLYVI